MDSSRGSATAGGDEGHYVALTSVSNCPRFHWCNHKDYYYSGAGAARGLEKGAVQIVIALYCLDNTKQCGKKSFL